MEKDSERAQWVFVPQVGVGPLRFGMTPDDVSAALGSEAPARRLAQRSSGSYELIESPFTKPRVTVYYAMGQTLACVAVDALAGPQVMLDGTALVARVPSEVEDWLCKHAEADEFDLIYTHAADPGSGDLGLIVRAQRAGDIVLTRPLFLIREWAENNWDCVPGEEWSRF
ncbi:hypothetical protein ACIBW9_14050 [Streptomyces sp. NPDC049541]|uniref:hypothetical protein n=1 Tax=Streptomyces sp. NPDC049541 TaxID=3365594 RepID=UPI0037BCA4EC